VRAWDERPGKERRGDDFQKLIVLYSFTARASHIFPWINPNHQINNQTGFRLRTMENRFRTLDIEAW
jgi:hypothetical protein